MTGNQQAFATLVGQYLDGNLAACRAIAAVRDGHADPDYIYHSTVRASHPELSSDFLRGVLRALQKHIERGMPHE
jgi:hypothetical protein